MNEELPDGIVRWYQEQLQRLAERLDAEIMEEVANVTKSFEERVTLNDVEFLKRMRISL